jgi:hypothetical protein
MSHRDSRSLEKERIRLTKAQADHEERRVAQARSEQTPSDIVVMASQSKTANVRARLLALAPRSAQVAIDARNINEFEEHVRDLLYEALNELSRNGLPEDVRTRVERRLDSMDAAAAPDEQPMGRHKPKAKPGRQRKTRTV